MSPRDVITTETVPIGSLAAALFGAEREMLAAEKQLERFLDSLYPLGWCDYEYGHGTVDVYAVTPSDAAVFALFRAGFRQVRQHPHARSKFTRCACRPNQDVLA